MPFDFLPGLTGDPQLLSRRFAAQPTRGVPNRTGADYRQARVNGGGIQLTPQRIPAAALSPDGSRAQQLVGKIAMEPQDMSMGDLDPESLVLLNILAHVHRKYAVSVISGAHNRWLFDPSRASTGPAFFTMEDFNNMMPHTVFHDMVAGGYTIAASPNENLALTIPGGQYAVGGYSYSGDAVQRGGSGSDLPIAIRNSPQTWEDPGTSAYVRIITIPDGSGNFTYKSILAATGSSPVIGDFTGATWSGSLNRPARLYDASDLRIANAAAGIADQLSALWVTGATLVADDIFEIPPRHAGWATPSFTEYRISSVQSLVIVDGEEFVVDGSWTFTAEQETVEGPDRIHGRQGATSRRKGQRTYSVELSREQIDSRLSKAIHEGETVSLVLHAESATPITGLSAYRRILIGMPVCDVTGSLYVPGEGADNTDETVTFTAANPGATTTAYEGITFDQECTVVVDNSQTAL